MSRRTATQPTAPRAVAEGQGFDTGSPAVAVVVEDVAEGTRSTIKRARRADPLNRVDGCTAGMRTAAAIYRQAVEHIEAGRGMARCPTPPIACSNPGLGLAYRWRCLRRSAR